MRTASLIAWLLAVGGAHSSAIADTSTDDRIFSREIWPLLERHCAECHGDRVQEGGFRVDTPAAMLRGGDSGPTLVPGEAHRSELVRRVSLPTGHADAMPPRGTRLSPAQIRMLATWVDSGAHVPADFLPPPHWSLVPPMRPRIPVDPSNWSRAPIDAFVSVDLQRRRLVPASPASRSIWFRRLSLDLRGIPPTIDELDDWEADASPDAKTRWIDRWLASPHFGLRWARHWLDAARYADSHGFQRDDFRDLWPYRDWVVDAFNHDLPFDQFSHAQLAGDLAPDAPPSTLVATGFLRSAACNVEAGSDPEETRVNQVHDRVQTLGTVWLGTTLECCQCHDHKYDRFTMRDYYGLFALFNNGALEAERSNPKVPGSIRFVGAQLTLVDSPDPARRVVTQVMRELPEPRPTHIFLRGDFRTPGPLVSPSFPTLIPPAPPASGTLDRRALVRWLFSDQQPLVARVAANRLWGELFGRGLVGTPEDFGVKGERPSHPELLDWLAIEYRASDWSTKRLLREMVFSATYAQSSNAPSVSPFEQSSVEQPRARLHQDDASEWLGRMARLRLDAESIRDNALAISGLLSHRQGGPPIRPPQPAGLWVKVGGERYDYVESQGEERFRRGLYVVLKRAAPYPSFVNFDGNNRQTCRVRRPRTNNPLQALTLLNDPTYVEMARHLSRRIVNECPAATLEEQLTFAWRLTLSRSPDPTELETLKDLWLAQHSVDAASRRGGLQSGESAEQRAWLAIATVLLNLDETITRP